MRTDSLATISSGASADRASSRDARPDAGDAHSSVCNARMALTGSMPAPDDIACLRADLAEARFSVDALTELWGADADAALRRGHRVPALRAVGRSDSALASIAAFFVLGEPVLRPTLDAALPSLGAVGIERLGFGVDDGSGISPLFELRPHSFVDGAGVGSWWIASDLGEAVTGRPLREDHVLGVGGASLTLSGLAIGTPVDAVLDLGTGCGIQALHASRHAERVVATDVSRRALEIAAFNAELNGVRHIEFRHGSLFEPVAGERFDRIVSNPPFVITPRASGVPAYEYRDGGMTGDDLVAAVVRGSAEHLAEGGVAQLLGNWEHRDGRGLDRVREWVPDGVDAWVVEREVQDVALYAETWIRDGGTRPGRRFDELTNAWLDDFAARGTTGVGFGYITLRRSGSSTPLRRFERLDGRLGHNATGLGERIAASLAAHDWLAEHALAASRLVVASDVTEERHYWPGVEDPTVMTLRQGGGFGREFPLDTALAGFVGACDGELSVQAIIAALGDLLQADAAALAAELTSPIAELVFTGFLAPAA